MYLVINFLWIFNQAGTKDAKSKIQLLIYGKNFRYRFRNNKLLHGGDGSR